VGQRDPIGGSEKPMKIPIKRPSKDEERKFDSNFPSSDFSTETEEDDDFTSEAIAITIDKLSRKFGEAVSKSQVRDRNKKMAYFFAVLKDKLGLGGGK
jgi:hypothetical protein